MMIVMTLIDWVEEITKRGMLKTRRISRKKTEMKRRIRNFRRLSGVLSAKKRSILNVGSLIAVRNICLRC